MFDFGTPQDLIVVVKDMGQVASRMIRAISLSVALDDVKMLPRALRCMQYFLY